MKFVRALAAVAALVVGSDFASAGDKGCSSCGGSKFSFGHRTIGVPQPTTLFNGGHHQKLPVFQAAPWYMYWPYDGHFLTPAPINGAFYGPPLTGNFPVNPYFPHPGGAAGFGHGPVPGAMPPVPFPGGR